MEKKSPLWQQKMKKLLQRYPALEYILYALIGLLVLLIYFSGRQAKKQELPANEPLLVSEEDGLEGRLQSTLASIKGAGQVEVMITYATGNEIVTAMNVDKSSSDGSGSSSQSESSRPATLNDEPLVLYEKEPQIRGVVIVAQGAGDIFVRMDLIKAAQTLLDISSSQVEVFEMDTVQEK